MAAPLPTRALAAFRGFVTPDARMADEAACVASVLLAVVLARAIGAQMIGWAAFTAFVLMKGDVTETILRGALRLVGTALGAGLALLLVPLAVRSTPVAMVEAAVVGAIGLYGMLTARRAYAWLLFGLTFEMVLLDKLAHPNLDALWFARTRMLEVAAGTVACVAVSVAARLLARRDLRAANPPSQRLGWQPNAARHAAQTGLTLALLPLIAQVHPIEALAQVGVTVMAVMIVPVAGLGSSGLVPVSRRLFQRALGCLAGGALALAVLLAAQGNTAGLIAGTALGIMIGRHIENGSPAIGYLGFQFTLTILVTLVPDDYAQAQIHPAIDRLLSVLLGMALLEPVLLAWHWLAPQTRPAEAITDSGANE
jgi:uncharacterized membrane protein YccC